MYIFKKCWLFKLSTSKGWNLCRNMFMRPKIQISENQGFQKNTPRSYQLRLGVIIWGSLFNFRYPGPQRAWKGGLSSTSWHHFGGTRGIRMWIPKSCFLNTVSWFVHICRYLMSIILFRCSPLASIIMGFDVNLQPLSSIIVCIFYEFQPGSICPRTAKGIPKDGQRESTGTKWEPKVGPKEATGTT